MSTTLEQTRDTIWLSDSISEPVKDVIGKFYALADHKGADAGPRLASEVFTEDAVLIGANGTFRGSSEIAKSRENAWKVVTKRSHRVLQVFAGQATPDIALIGVVDQDFANGKSLAARFATLIKLAWPEGQAKPRISYMEVFADTAPIAAVLKA